ncbi:hypothetical protein ACFFQW_47125 [Umezawaea endophytica]|uniref:Leucine rich repeat (LRR) protein n=1 Tax=Umezawaea endophytica TaxID=1654476 RepID=A0A9X3AFX3_9PSEU|nr:hypothetical protein [Umezawaea endophytica]MCS7477720.1 hypothetical protein [Umezawaea endophytica]
MGVGDRVTPDELAEHAGPGGLVGQARDGDPLWRAAVANSWVAMPEALRRELLDDPDAGVRKAAAGYPHPPAPVDLHAGLLADEATREAVASYAELTAEAHLPLAERVAHLDSPIPCFRLCAAMSADLPEDVVRRLHSHEDVQVRRTVAQRSDTPGAVLEALVAEHGEALKHRPLLVEHPNFPPEAFTRLAVAENPRRRSLAARGPDLPADVLTALARDTDASVRGAVARHRNLPVPVLLTLLADEDQEVAEAASTNPALPSDAMRDLLDRAGL